jgi:flagellar M-ring protein FliF
LRFGELLLVRFLALPLPSTTQKAMSWLAGNWKMLGMLAVGLVGLLMLRSLATSAPTAPSAASASDVGATLKLLHPEAEAEQEEAGGTTGPAKPKRRLLVSQSDPREELTEMVNENPEAAAAILRSWIAEAS